MSLFYFLSLVESTRVLGESKCCHGGPCQGAIVMLLEHLVYIYLGAVCKSSMYFFQFNASSLSLSHSPLTQPVPLYMMLQATSSHIKKPNSDQLS